MTHNDWPTLEEIAHTHQISLHTLRQRYTTRKTDPGIEVWRERPQEPYRINPDHVGVLLEHGRTPPWRDPKNLAEEYMFMCESFRDEDRALQRLSQAYDRKPESITRALKRAKK